MDNVPTIPALPELPTTGIARTAVNGTPYMLKAVTVENDTIRVFDTAQMTAYGQQCYAAGVQAERERAARVCEQIYVEEQKEAECYGFARECAAAIRKG
jgi:hypothetical protein